MNQDINASLEEYRKIVEQAQKIELTNTIKAKEGYLKAAKILLSLCTYENPNYQDFENQAKLLLNKVYELNKKFGRVIPKYRISKSQTTTIEAEIDIDEEEEETASFINKVCGLDKLKEEINLKIILPLKKPEIFEKFKQKMKSGILMYGPPGCGKSMIAEAVANDAGIPFFNVKASDIKSKWVGETEMNISRIFENARRQQPAIIFIDEFESIGRSRDSNQASFEKNFVSHLLAEIDGLGNKTDKIILIAATNEPWEIDNALLRSGRFGTKIYVGLPDKNTRKQIILKNISGKPLDEDLDITEIVDSTEGYSAADLVGLCESATELAISRYIKDESSGITKDDFFSSLAKVKPVSRSWFNNAVKQIQFKGLEEEFIEVLKLSKTGQYEI